MALLYGKGSRAFISLQREIIQHSDDKSIFAWYTNHTYSGILVPRPSAFAGCNVFFPFGKYMFTRVPYTMTNRGLALDAIYRSSLQNRVDHLGLTLLGNCALLPLNCTTIDTDGRPIAIIFKCESGSIYIRYLPGEIVDIDEYWENLFDMTGRTTMYIREPKYTNNPAYRYPQKITCPINRYPGAVISGDPKNPWILNLQESFVSPPSHIVNPKTADHEAWHIDLRDGSGFAVLTFRVRNPPLILTFKYVAGLGRSFNLHLWRYHPASRIQVVHEFSDQLEDYMSHQELLTEPTLQIGNKIFVVLKKGPTYNGQDQYTLSFRSV